MPTLPVDQIEKTHDLFRASHKKASRIKSPDGPDRKRAPVQSVYSFSYAAPKRETPVLNQCDDAWPRNDRKKLDIAICNNSKPTFMICKIVRLFVTKLRKAELPDREQANFGG